MRREALVGPAELAIMLGVSRQRVTALTDHRDFPEPYAKLIMGKVWALADVQAWAKKRGRKLYPLDT
jgi:hypothetical protein